MNRNFLPLLLVAFVFFGFEAYAQDKKADPKVPTGPVKEWVDAENAMIDKLNDGDKKSVFILRNKYSVIRVIRVVERDVGNAVKSCVGKNPDMKASMNDRFSQWKSAVDPIIKTAEKQLNTDIDAQKIVKPAQFRSVMALNDKAFKYGEDQIQKTPVTTKEACQGLVSSMNDTEDNMIQLLRQTLLPEAVIKTRAEQEDKKILQRKNMGKTAKDATPVPADTKTP